MARRRALIRAASLVLFVTLTAWLAGGTTARAQLLSPGPLSQAHAQLEGDGKCQSCHASGAQIAETRCSECHQDVARDRQRKEGLHGGAFRGQACASCHVEHLGRRVALIRWPGPERARFDHTQTGFALQGAHAKVACADCHEQKNARGAATFLGAEPRCASCHEDPHEKRFGDRCETCHSETSFGKLELTRFDHDLARFPLDGAHTRVACASCHGKPAKYQGLEFGDCKSCHDDAGRRAHEDPLEGACKTCHASESWTKIVMPRAQHPALSLAAGHERTACKTCHDQGLRAPPSRGDTCASCHAPVHEAAFGPRCEQCHASIKWTGLPDAIGRRAHGSTPFPLRGMHGDVACAGCHQPELPRAERYRGLAFDQCASCHADVHRGTLAEHGDCATCHNPLGFAPSLVEPTVHARFGFALEGNHAATACSGCHKQLAAPRLAWSLPEERCQDCHQNPHGTQFAREMKDDGCAHCHQPSGWRMPRFEHTTWPLTGAHASAACSGCHEPSARDRDALAVTSYRGAPRACAGCHDDVHAGQFQSSAPERSCESCHQTAAFALPSFDHAETARYPLEGAHAEASCASCHPSVTLKNGDQATRYRLGYQKCSDCHADPHGVPGEARR
ncbi:MAG: hypothetical protein ABW252_17535 [Polyangiales bacterium]